MFTGYFEVSVNFNEENRSEEFIILYYLVFCIRFTENLWCFIRELFSFLNTYVY